MNFSADVVLSVNDAAIQVALLAIYRYEHVKKKCSFFKQTYVTITINTAILL